MERLPPARLSGVPGLPLPLGAEPATIYQGAIVQVEGGWRSAFAYIRAHLRPTGPQPVSARDLLALWVDEQLVSTLRFSMVGKFWTWNAGPRRGSLSDESERDLRL